MNWSRVLRLLVVSVLLFGSVGAAVPTIVAADPAVQMSGVTVTPSDPNTGETVTIETTISNLQNSPSTVEVRDVYIRAPGSSRDYARVEELGSIAPGGSITIPVLTTFETAGQKRLTLRVVVQDDEGEYYTYSYPVFVDVSDPTVRAGLSAGTPESGTGTEVTLTNFGNTNLSEVEIIARADGEIVERNFLFDVDPGSSQRAVFDTDDIEAETVSFVANYTAAGGSHTTSLDVDLDSRAPVQGEIRLTGVEVARSGTVVSIRGDAANLGSTDTQSVLVRIPSTEFVGPVSPSGEYFIGGIEGSEFARFELTAQVESGAESIPVEISYIVDNERVTTTQQIHLDAASAAAADGAADDDGESSQRGSGGLPVTAIAVVVGVLVLVIVAVGVFRWRQ